MKLNLITISLMTIFVLIGVACGTSLCLEANIPGVPGTPEICYSTPAKFEAAKAALAKSQGDAGVNSNQNP